MPLPELFNLGRGIILPDSTDGLVQILPCLVYHKSIGRDDFMNNEKTGTFIKALRTEKGLTQRELAERLHITDRAVSKWERGLNAPDIALLEPLAEILEVSVVELIRGERIPEEEHTPALEGHAREVLAYSGREVRRRERSTWKRAALLLACALAVLAFVIGFVGWRTGYFFVLDRCPSPDGAYETTVYRKGLEGRGFSWRDMVSVIDRAADGPEWRAAYGGCTYQGLWWSPDSEKYVLALDYGESTHLWLTWLTLSNQSNLNAYLDMAVGNSPLVEHGIPWDDGAHGMLDVDYQFIQWGPDGDNMLIWYSFTGEKDGLEHSGYFWFDCELICISGLFELDAERTPDVPFSPADPIGGS